MHNTKIKKEENINFQCNGSQLLERGNTEVCT